MGIAFAGIKTFTYKRHSNIVFFHSFETFLEIHFENFLEASWKEEKKINHISIYISISLVD